MTHDEIQRYHKYGENNLNQLKCFEKHACTHAIPTHASNTANTKARSNAIPLFSAVLSNLSNQPTSDPLPSTQPLWVKLNSPARLSSSSRLSFTPDLAQNARRCCVRDSYRFEGSKGVQLFSRLSKGLKPFENESLSFMSFHYYSAGGFKGTNCALASLHRKKPYVLKAF